MYTRLFLISAAVFAAFGGFCRIMYMKAPLSKGIRAFTLSLASLGVLSVLSLYGYIVIAIFMYGKGGTFGKVLISAMFLAASFLPVSMKLFPKYYAFVVRRDDRGYKLSESVSYSSTTKTTHTTWRVTIGDEADETALDGLMKGFLIAAAFSVGIIAVMFFFTGKLM